eukprot:gene17725-24085_t
MNPLSDSAGWVASNLRVGYPAILFNLADVCGDRNLVTLLYEHLQRQTTAEAAVVDMNYVRQLFKELSKRYGLSVMKSNMLVGVHTCLKELANNYMGP